MCRVKDLIKVGVFNSATAAVEARTTGNSPDYFQMSKRGRVLYPRTGVVQWLREKINAKYSKDIVCSKTEASEGVSQ